MSTPANAAIIITGVHHTPAIELIKQLKDDPKINWRIEYIGHIYPAETHIPNTIIPKLKVGFHHLQTGKFDRCHLLETIKGIPKTLIAIIKSYYLINLLKPSVIVSFGGYVSVPVIIAAYLHRLPSITHEQTTTISLSTKINSFFVNKIALSFDAPSTLSVSPQKTIITGNLLRREIFDNTTQKFTEIKKPFIYVTGGHQGSTFINGLILKNIQSLTKKYSIIHQIGNNIPPNLALSKYFPVNYIDLEDIGWVLQNCDLIISRSGANISQEIIALEKNSILIPLPNSQQNEQFKNALWVKKHLPNKTIIIPQSKLTSKTLLSAVNKLSSIKSTAHPQSFSPNYKLLNLIHEFL